MFRPYTYQSECLKAITKIRKQRKKRALVVMAPGLGKTVTAVLDVRRWLKDHRGERVLYLCHQNDILDQAHRTCLEVLGKKVRYAFFTGRDKKQVHEADMVFASFQTMRSRTSRFDPSEFSYILIDESHHTHAATYLPVLQYFKPKFLLGITATPDRGDLQDIRLIYGEEIFDLPLEHALAEGLLTEVDYRVMTDEFSSLESVDTPIGKMSISELNRRLFVPKRDEELVKVIQRHMKHVTNPRVIVFCRSIRHCDNYEEIFPDAVAIHSQMSDQQQRDRLKDFRTGKTKVVLTVDKFNEGVDIPEANVIVFLRSTSSPTIFIQQLGRGLRKAQGKDNVLILDFVANIERLEMIRDFFQEAIEREEKSCRFFPSMESRTPVSVSVGSVNFNEKSVREILKKIEQIRLGYSRELLIKQIMRLAEELGRVPKQEDIRYASVEGKCASVFTFTKVFGSLTAAQEAAGMESNYRRNISQKVLISDLKRLAKKLGRTPRTEDVDRASAKKECASGGTYIRVFGSFAAALKAAGMKPNIRRNPTEQVLISDLKQLAKKLGRTPRIDDINQAHQQGLCFSSAAYYRTLDSFNAAILAAGLQLNQQRRAKKSRTELIADLKRLAKKLGRTPLYNDINEASKADECASHTAFRDEFGSVSAALQVAGFKSTNGNTKKKKGDK